MITKDTGVGRMKLHYFYETGTYELYNLDADLSETVNLLASDPDTFTGVASELRDDLVAWLTAEGAQYGTWRASGDPVDPPPAISAADTTFIFAGTAIGQGLDGLASADRSIGDLTISLNAEGTGATFGTNATGVGLFSTGETGGTSSRRRINGSINEGITFSFNADLTITSMQIGAISTNGNEELVLEHVSGPNPFTGLTGYSGDYVVGPSQLTFSTAGGQSTPLNVPFGENGQSPLRVEKGAVLRVTTGVTADGGVLFNQISVTNVVQCTSAADFDGNGSLTPDDIVAYAAAASAGGPGHRAGRRAGADGL